MAKRRPSGDGMVRKREDGRWEGRIVVGHKDNGDSIFRYVYADTQKELTANWKYHIWFALFTTMPIPTAHLRNALKIGI